MVTGSESHKDRVVTWRVALVGLIGVLLAALIGAGSAWITAKVTSDSQAAENQRDFLRSQRQVIWSKFSADIISSQQGVFNTASVLDAQLGKPLPADFAEKFNAEKDIAFDRVSSLASESGSVRIISPPNVNDDTEVVVRSFVGIFDPLYGYMNAVFANDPNAPQLKDAFWSKFDEIEGQRNTLIDSMNEVLTG